MEERLSTEVILKETIKQNETIIEEQNIKVSNTNIIILVLVLVFETLRLLQEPSIPYLDLFRPLFLKTIKKRIPINLHKNICTQ